MTRIPLISLALGAMLAAGCATLAEPVGAPRKETIVALTADARLLVVNAGQPQRVVAERPVTGLQPGERLVGIDYRVARGQLYGLGTSSRLYRLDPATGRATAINAAPFAAQVTGGEHGFDFNPTVDRIRWVTPDGFNARLHPDTGALVDADPNAPGLQLDGTLVYADGDANAGRAARIAAAAYTYNQRDEKITTNYVIDAALGTLAVQGSIEGTVPVVSPNTGRLRTVGPLGLGALRHVAFDIADVNNAAFVSAAQGDGASRLYEVDLATGRATPIGPFAGGARVVGIAIEP